jgi:hypothetical protein
MIKCGIAAIAVILATSAMADETMKFRIIAHGVSVNSHEIGTKPLSSASATS